MRIAASVLVVGTGLAFGALGISTTALGDSALIRFFGLVVGIYAVSVFALLVQAWRCTSAALPRKAAVLGVALVAVWFGGSFDHGILSELEMAGVGIVALAAAINWWAIRLIARTCA
jgi:hypothetical protein